MKHELYALVIELRGLGYNAADIGRMVGRSAERVRQILVDMGVAPPRLRTLEELPIEIRERIDRLRNASDASPETTPSP